MSTIHTLTLSGCSPVPLAHYLKALGVLRVIAESEDGDAAAKGYWQNDQFKLESVFEFEKLLDFFAYNYQPTPVLNPWNGDGGFFPDSRPGAVKVLRSIEASKTNRLVRYRNAIGQIRDSFKTFKISEKPSDDQKADAILTVRNSIDSAGISWLDAVCALTASGPKYPDLLGSGGNDGSMDFGKNFIMQLESVMNYDSGQPTAHSRGWLKASLLGSASFGSTQKTSVGQFFPGAAGGANSTSGFKADSRVNPWDFILMIEGAMVFAAASMRRLETHGAGALCFPFSVRSNGVGYHSASVEDEKKAGYEIWLPLWNSPTGYSEVMAVFGEGRAQAGGRPAKTGIDFARAVISLGIDRGITAFHRYALLERNGQACFATPLDRIAVRPDARSTLFADVENWHNQLRRKSVQQEKPATPGSVSKSLNLLERAMLDLCRDGRTDSTETVIIALGQAERALARSQKWTNHKAVALVPLHGLRPGWLDRLDGVEFRLAASLAGMRLSFGKGKETLWLRHHLEPLKRLERSEYFRAYWSEKPSENDVVWRDGCLISVFNNILTRRIQRADKAGVHGWPDWSPRYAKLEDVTAFIDGCIDENLLAELIWGLSLIDWQRIKPEMTERSKSVPSSFYALLKLCFRAPEIGTDDIPLVPAIHQRASAGDGLAASKLAARRLRASGEAPLVRELRVSADTAKRTAAALLFPISPRDMTLLKLTLQHQTENQTA